MIILELYSINFPKNISGLEIENSINCIKNAYELNLFYRDIHFDLSNIEFISPTGLALLVSAIKDIHLKQLYNKFFLTEPKKKSVSNYFDRMDFYQNVNYKRDEKINRYDCRNSLMEINQIINQNDSNNITEKLNRIFTNQLGEKYINNISDIVSYSIGELADNIICHSESPNGGYVCAQTYTDFIEICFVDSGVGIKNSISKAFPEYNDKPGYEAIDFSLHKSITSKTIKHTGEGLFFTKRFIEANGGEITIFSDDGCFKILQSGIIIKRTAPYWQGTALCVKYNINNKVHAKCIFDEEFPLDSMDDDIDSIF